MIVVLKGGQGFFYPLERGRAMEVEAVEVEGDGQMQS